MHVLKNVTPPPINYGEKNPPPTQKIVPPLPACGAGVKHVRFPDGKFIFLPPNIIFIRLWRSDLLLFFVSSPLFDRRRRRRQPSRPFADICRRDKNKPKF